MHLRTLGAAPATIVMVLVAGCSSPAPTSAAPAASTPSSAGPDPPLRPAPRPRRDPAPWRRRTAAVCSGRLVAWPAIPAGSDAPTGKGTTATPGSIFGDEGTKQ